VLDADADRTISPTVAAYSSLYFTEDDDTGWGFDPEWLWLPPRFLPVEGGTLVIDGMDEWSFGPLPSDGGELMRDGTVVSVSEVRRNTQSILVREYYHADMDHYFLTANAVEFDALDSGDIPGWRPTGVIHFAYLGKPAPEYVPVCRFLFTYPGGYSHFMGSFPDECAALAGSGAAILETSEAFHMAASVGPNCPLARIVYSNGSSWAGSTGVPIYRLWNGQADANHRYVVDKSDRDAMVARGWVSEGAGPDGVVMCGYVADRHLFDAGGRP
jgi:hypothetical protein